MGIHVNDVFAVFDFGKHKGLTVGEVLEVDPGYVLWAHENTERLRLSPELEQQVRQHIAELKDAANAQKAKLYQKHADAVQAVKIIKTLLGPESDFK